MGKEKIIYLFRIKIKGVFVDLVASSTLVHPTIYKDLQSITDKMIARPRNRSCSP
jgi:hypothetical protein